MTETTMKLLDNDVLERVAELRVISNTAYYLFNALRGEQCIVDAAQEATTKQIKDALKAIKAKKDRQFGDQIAQYALLVALSFKLQSEYRRFLASYQDKALHWLAEFKAILLDPRSENATSTLNVSLPRNIIASVEQVVGSPAVASVEGLKP